MSAVWYLLIHLAVTAAICCAVHLSCEPGQEGPVRYSRKAKLILVFAGLLYTAFAAARMIGHDGLGGNDSLIYQMFFQEANCSLAEFFTVRTEAVSEPLYRVLVWLVRQVTAEYRVFLAVVHGFLFLSVVNFCRFCRISRENLFSFACVFLICGELFYVFCIVRHSLALACGLWMFALLNEKKYGLALIPLVMSVGMHLAAIILIPVYVFVLLMDKLQAFTLKKTALWLAAILAAECIALPVFNYLIRNTRYVHYLGGGLSLGTYALLLVLTVSFFLLCRGRQPSYDRHFEIWVVLCSWICLPLQLNYSIFYRSLLMFSPMFYRVIPFVAARYRAMEDGSLLKKLIRWGGIIALGGYVLIRMTKMYTGDFGSYGLYPYRIG